MIHNLDENGIRQDFIEIIKKESEPEITPIPYYGVAIDMPRKSGFWHGSSFLINCPNPTKCNIIGDLITVYDEECMSLMEKDLKQLGCKIEGTHYHKAFLKEGHVHFSCEEKGRQGALNIANYLKFW